MGYGTSFFLTLNGITALGVRPGVGLLHIIGLNIKKVANNDSLLRRLSKTKMVAIVHILNLL